MIRVFFLLATMTVISSAVSAQDTAQAEATTQEELTADKPAPSSLLKNMEQAINEAIVVEAAAQKKLDDWNEERDRLLEEARNLKFELQWLELQQQKLRRYVAANDKKITSLEKAHARYAVISLSLENILLKDLARLEQSVADSPSFLIDERDARIQFLRQSLDDPELIIGEKYRRFCESLNVEVEYGKKLEVSNQKGMLDDKETDLIHIRAGRIGYYCLTMDRKRAGIWDRKKERFISMPENLVQTIRDMELMAQTQQYYNIVMLPVPGGKL